VHVTKAESGVISRVAEAWYGFPGIASRSATRNRLANSPVVTACLGMQCSACATSVGHRAGEKEDKKVATGAYAVGDSEVTDSGLAVWQTDGHLQ